MNLVNRYAPKRKVYGITNEQFFANKVLYEDEIIAHLKHIDPEYNGFKVSQTDSVYACLHTESNAVEITSSHNIINLIQYVTYNYDWYMCQLRFFDDRFDIALFKFGSDRAHEVYLFTGRS